MSATSPSASSSIPTLTEPVDRFRAGAVSFKQTSLLPHPVESIQATAFEREWEQSLAATARAFGAAAAIERRVDRASLEAIARLPGGPPSSHALLDSYTGRDSTIAFEDSLGQANFRPQLPKAGVHELLEPR